MRRRLLGVTDTRALVWRWRAFALWRVRFTNARGDFTELFGVELGPLTVYINDPFVKDE